MENIPPDVETSEQYPPFYKMKDFGNRSKNQSKVIYKYIKRGLFRLHLDLIILSAKQKFSSSDHKNYVINK